MKRSPEFKVKADVDHFSMAAAIRAIKKGGELSANDFEENEVEVIILPPHPETGDPKPGKNDKGKKAYL